MSAIPPKPLIRMFRWTAPMLVASFSATTAAQTYTYDNLNRLVEASYTDGSRINYTYDPSGNITQRTITAKKTTNPANGYSYEVITCGTWTECRATAQSLGGDLVSIRSKAENDWLMEKFLAQAKNPWGYWIGFTDNGHEGQWTWVSGEAVTYTNWHPGEPNNAGQAEQFAMMIKGVGTWNDGTDSTTYTNQAIVEYIPASDSKNLIANYTFNDCTATDNSKTANHATMVGLFTCVAGRFGTNAVRFTGSNYIVSNTIAGYYNNEITVAAWIAPQGAGNYNPRIIGVGAAGTSGQYYGIILDGTSSKRRVQACCYNSATTDNGALFSSNSFINDNAGWRHVALTIKGNQAKFFIDGVPDNTATTKGPIQNFSNALVQIGLSNNGLDVFVGDLDELKIYNRALGASEIESIFKFNLLK